MTLVLALTTLWIALCGRAARLRVQAERVRVRRPR